MMFTAKKVSEVFESGNQCYGAAKIAAILRKGGTATSERNVAAIMHETGMSSIRTNSKAVYKETMRSTPNIVKQRFSADEPNTVWVSDITEFRFGGRKYYICIVLDLFARAVVGCRIGTRGSTQLVKSTFVQAHNARKPNAGLIFHRDRGGPFFCKRLILTDSHFTPENKGRGRNGRAFGVRSAWGSPIG